MRTCGFKSRLAHQSLFSYLIKYGRVVELVDSLDSGSSVHCGRAGSSPASPTKDSIEIERFRCFFLLLGYISLRQSTSDLRKVHKKVHNLYVLMRHNHNHSKRDDLAACVYRLFGFLFLDFSNPKCYHLAHMESCPSGLRSQS